MGDTVVTPIQKDMDQKCKTHSSLYQPNTYIRPVILSAEMPYRTSLTRYKPVVDELIQTKVGWGSRGYVDMKNISSVKSRVQNGVLCES